MLVSFVDLKGVSSPQTNVAQKVVRFSDIEWRILQRQINRDSKALIEEYVSLRTSAEHYLDEKNCKIAKLLTCIMDVKHVKMVSKDVPLVELERATCVSEVFLGLIKRNLISFLQYSIIKRVITKLCPESKQLQEQLETYEAHFNQYIKRRVCESSIYHEGRFEMFTSTDSKERVELTLITDDNWDDYTPLVRLIDLEDVVATCLNIDRFVLELKSIEPHCLRIRYAVSVHIVNSVFPLNFEEWNKLTHHGIAEMRCLQFHYTKHEKCMSE